MMPDHCTDNTEDSLRELMASVGIANSFVDFSGATVAIPQADQYAVLSAMGFDANNPDKELAALQAQPGQSLLPPVVIVTKRGKDMDCELEFVLPADHSAFELCWRVCTEHGERSDWTQVSILSLTRTRLHDNQVRCLLPISLQKAPEGYHRFELEVYNNAQRVISSDTLLVVAPERCYEADWIRDNKKLWGFSVQLYSVSSSRGWGMGDFADLQALIRSAAQQGAGFLVLNPLHAGPLHQPDHCSPYSPVDRRWLNPLYIAPELEPAFEASGAQQWLTSDTNARQWLNDARTGDWINYTAVTALKLHVLAQMFAYIDALPADNSQQQQLQRFIDAGGKSLQDYADWQADRHMTTGIQLTNKPRFFCYLQWLADTQLATCQALAKTAGMAIGLVRDLAVGSARDGSEVRCSDGAFCTGASIGAPPDPLAPQGQNWGLPPLHPLVLRQRAYAQFIELLRSNMTHCGALRIDHVMSLMRLWWCPYEGSGHGSYVAYNDEELFALLRLESQRNQCVIIGEDLGIVPQTVRQHLDNGGIYSNLLFYFEKDSAHRWRAPEHYRPRALAMLANHDVPTLAAWWNTEDLHMRRALGLLPDDAQRDAALADRHHDKTLVLHLLESQWLLPANRFANAQQPSPVEVPMDTALASALMRCLARSNSQLVSLQLEDLALMTTPVNIPGTSSEYKNWQRKLPPDLHLMLDQQPCQEMLAGVRAERG